MNVARLSRRNFLRTSSAAAIATFLPPLPLRADDSCDAFGEGTCPPIPGGFPFSDLEEKTLRAAADRIVPAFDNGTVQFPGAGHAGAFEYIRNLLNAFFDGSPGAPHIYPAGRTAVDKLLGTTSGTKPDCKGGHENVPTGWLPLPEDKELGWRKAIQRFQNAYRIGLAALEGDSKIVFLQTSFKDLDPFRQTLLLEAYDAANQTDRVSGVHQAGGGEAALQPIQSAPSDPRTVFMNLLVTHTMEAIYGDPVYGGNIDRAGWKLVGFGGPHHVNIYTKAQLETFGQCDLGLPVNLGFVSGLLGG